MLKLRIFLCVISTFPGTFVMAEPGFWDIDSIDIPDVIKGKGNSVYQIIVLSPTPQKTLDRDGYEVFLSREKDLLEADMNKPATEPPEGELGDYYQALSCMDAGVDPCELYQSLAYGTGFEGTMEPDVRGIWTSYSIVEGLTQNEGQQEVAVNVLLVDKSKKVVFDTRLQGQSAKMVKMATDIGVVQFQLSKKIGEPLVFGELKVSSESDLEDIFIAGFPLVQREETNKEDYYAFPLKRYSLSVTIGEIFEDPQHSRDVSEATHVECDADSAPGMSGAPAFNEQGEVIGILIRPTKHKVGSILATKKQIQEHFTTASH